MNKSSKVRRLPCAFESVRWSPESLPCPTCASVARRVWEVERVALDLGIERLALLLVRVGVYRCVPCRRHFRGQPPFLRPDAIYTRRVVTAAVQSVVADGMAVTRVVERMARDFHVRPSEASIRGWCRRFARDAELGEAHTQWVLASFSGVLCIDEVYQNRVALLLAVDPASPGGDRLVGYELVQEDVERSDVEAFLERLRDAGIKPAQVITDGSSLYPTVLAKVWPQAAHQLCLFHETRTLLRAALKVVKAVRAEVPKAPAAVQRIGRRRLRHDPTAAHPDDRASRVAWVQQLAREGRTITEIARQTGHGRVTVRRWLKETAKPALDLPVGGRRAQQRASVEQLHREGVPIREIVRRTGHSRTTVREWLRGSGSRKRDRSHSPAPAPHAPPAGWVDWDQVRQFRRLLASSRYRLTARQGSLSAAERTDLDTLFAAPLGATLRTVHTFLQDWYAIWHEDGGARRSIEAAQERFVALRENGAAKALPSLRRFQARMTDKRFVQLSHFLRDPTWEATNNGAERTGRQFRHLQAARFRLRTRPALKDALNLYAAQQREQVPPPDSATIGRSTRGRRSRRNEAPALAAAA